jgi:hypothetical protein
MLRADRSPVGKLVEEVVVVVSEAAAAASV